MEWKNKINNNLKVSIFSQAQVNLIVHNTDDKTLKCTFSFHLLLSFIIRFLLSHIYTYLLT